MPKLLAILSNPDNEVKLRTDREIKKVNQVISPLAAHDFECIYKPALMIEELPGLIIKEKPDIIHFSGHGNKKALSFEDKDGNSDPLSAESLDIIFKETGRFITCLVINACNSSAISKRLKNYLPFIISFPGKIEDELSECFSRVFYESLSQGLTVEGAFRLAKAIIGNKIKDKRRLPRLSINKKHPAYRESIFAIPFITAKFVLGKKGMPVKGHSNMYHLEFGIGNMPSNASYVTYEFIDETIEEKDRYVLVGDLSSGIACRDYLYGNIILRAWIWFDSKKYGIGLQSTVKEGLENYYKEPVPLKLRPAFKDIISN